MFMEPITCLCYDEKGKIKLDWVEAKDGTGCMATCQLETVTTGLYLDPGAPIVW